MIKQKISTGRCTAFVVTMTMVVSASAGAQTSSTATPESDLQAIVVTGTRITGTEAINSLAPIEIVGAEDLRHVGQDNLSQVLAQIVPSFSVIAFGGDGSNLALMANLRGLSPNEALILVNGKRVHGTAQFNTSGGIFQGGAAPDLAFIPVAAIERIEVLQDGAAAQYGSDAIAGVINIILKSDRSGGEVSVTAGSQYEGCCEADEPAGPQEAVSGHFALPLGDRGFFNFTLEQHYQDRSVDNGPDARVSSPNGTLLSGVPKSWANLPGYPDLDIKGIASYHLEQGMYNSDYEITDGVHLYSFGSYAVRDGINPESYRLPNKVVYTADGVTTEFAPDGFNPLENLREHNYAITGGTKGTLSDWNWDASATYGQDYINVWLLNSANATLYANTGYTPSTFHDGSFTNSELSTDLDLDREFDVGLAGPLNVAFGEEYRRDSFTITAGDAASIYADGSQGYPGFQPTDAATHTRDAWSTYADLAVKPVTSWSIDVAGRFEDYSDFGTTLNGKLSSRYEFSPMFALRGTVSTGFRAPTLLEEYYSATTVTPTSASVLLPVDSPAARLLGISPLKPEKSTDFSVGLVARPIPDLHDLTVTLDGYQVRIDNRIVGTGTIQGRTGTTIVNPAVLAAIAAHGNVLDPTVTSAGVSLFTNGVDTVTRGVDLAINYPAEFSFGRIAWSLTGTYNPTEITKQLLSPVLYTPISAYNLEHGAALYKVRFGALFDSGPFGISLRETLYGDARNLQSPNNLAPYYTITVPAAVLTDLEFTYKIVKGLELAVGANNLFNKKPPNVSLLPGGKASATSGPPLVNGSTLYDLPLQFSPYGDFGGYYYARATYRF